MGPQFQQLVADSTLAAPLLDGRMVGFAVWIGLAVLSVALLLLIRTHWGQARPLSKCAALSLFAHFLLFMYAYGTHLLSPTAEDPPDVVMQLSYLDLDSKREDSAAEDSLAMPWEKLPLDDLVEPPTITPERVQPENPKITRRVSTAEWSAPVTIREDSPVNLPLPEYDDRIPEADSPQVTESPLRQSVVQAATIEKLEKPVPDPLPLQSELPDLPRFQDRQLAHPSRSEASASDGEDHLRLESRLQQLANVVTRSETADTRGATVDDLTAASNRDPKIHQMNGAAASPESSSSSDALAGLVDIPNSSGGTFKTAATPERSVAAVAKSVPRRLGDGEVMPRPFRHRTLEASNEVARQLGATPESDAAVSSALAWLASQQERDGHWDADRWGGGIESKNAGHDRHGAGSRADTGITGLALLAFLARGHTHFEGKYRKTVQVGLEYLLRSQATNGSLAGDAALYASMYSHGMASLALSESLAMTGDLRIKPFVERAVQYSVNSQHPTTGGWRYQPGDPGDMSQFGWQVMALKSASLAEVRIPQKTREGMLYFLQQCEHGQFGGLAGYRPGMPSSRPMSAEALVCRYFLDLRPDHQLVDETTDYLLGDLPGDGKPNLYYWYYGTLALFQRQDASWERWNRSMQGQLVPAQRSDGHLAGSWDPDTVWGSYGGRIYSTAMATLSLEVYYRYLPTISPDRPAEIARNPRLRWR